MQGRSRGWNLSLDPSVIDAPMLVLGVGLLFCAWVLRGTRGSASWMTLPSVALALAGIGLLGHQVLAQVMRPTEPDIDQCLALMSKQADEPVESIAEIAAPNTLGFVTGALWGVYWRMGEDVAALAQRYGIALTNVRTRGSRDNIRRMQGSANAGVGVVQGDVPIILAAAGQTDGGIRNLGALMALHPEPIHVLSRGHMPGAPSPSKLADLKGQRVVVAEDSEGAALTARYLLSRVDAGNDVEALKAERALCEVVTGTAAAMVVVAGKPNPLLLRLERLARNWPMVLQRLQFVPIQRSDLGPNLPDVYEKAELRQADYPWLTSQEPVPTLAVRSMLVSYDFGGSEGQPTSAKCLQVARLVCMLRQEQYRLWQPPYEPAWREVRNMTAAGLPASWPVSRCLPSPTQPC